MIGELKLDFYKKYELCQPYQNNLSIHQVALTGNRELVIGLLEPKI